MRKRNPNVRVEPNGARVVDVSAVIASPKGQRTLQAIERMRKRLEQPPAGSAES